MKKLFTAMILVLAAFHAFAWDEDISSSQKARSEALRAANLFEATIIGHRSVQVNASNNTRAIGASVGGLLGGLLGANNASGNNAYAVGAIGAAIGGLLGAKAADSVSSTFVNEVHLRLADGRMIAITESGQVYPSGAKVLLVQDTGGLRIAGLSGNL